MLTTRSILRITMVPSLLLSTAVGSAKPHIHVIKTRVRFLATSTSVRSGIGESQDVYLVELPSGIGSEGSMLARLVDYYSSPQAGFSPGHLSGEGPILRIRRDGSCDTPLADMPLRTAPGDPMAILPERFQYEPPLPQGTNINAVLPCYRTVRR